MLNESGYYFVSFLTAVSFIENLEAKQLSISVEEFETSLAKSKLAFEQFIHSSSEMDQVDLVDRSDTSVGNLKSEEQTLQHYIDISGHSTQINPSDKSEVNNSQTKN